MAFTAISSARGNEPTVNRLIGGDHPNFAGGGSAGTQAGFTGDLLDLKEDLVAMGWRVTGSGDGAGQFELEGQTAGSGTGVGGAFDVITSADGGNGTSVTGGFNRDGGGAGASWFLLKTPEDAAVQREFLWQMYYNGFDEANFQVRMSFNGFRGSGNGAPSDLIAPTATDEVYFAGSATDPGAADNFAPSGGGNMSYWIIGDVLEDYAFIYWNIRDDTGGNVFGVWAMDSIVAPNNGTNPPDTDDPDPYYHIISHEGASNSFDFFNYSEFGDSNNNSRSGKLENNVPGKSVIASIFLGESPQPADAGHWQCAIIAPREDDGDNWWDQPIHTVGFNSEVSMGSFMVGRFAEAPQFSKGWIRGRLIRFSTRIPAEPILMEDTEGNRYVNWNRWILPWHPTEPVFINK